MELPGVYELLMVLDRDFTPREPLRINGSVTEFALQPSSSCGCLVSTALLDSDGWLEVRSAEILTFVFFFSCIVPRDLDHILPCRNKWWSTEM